MDDEDMATVRAGGRNELGIWAPSSIKIRVRGAAAFGAIGPGSGSAAKTALHELLRVFTRTLGALNVGRLTDDKREKAVFG